MLACIATAVAWAERVSVNTAQQVAAQVAAGINPSGLRSGGDVELVYTAAAKSQSGLRSAGDDRVRPVLGYGSEGSVDAGNIPANVEAWLGMYQDEISRAVEAGMAASAETQKEWQGLLDGTSVLRASDPQLQTAKWSQSEPFNWMTPTIGSKNAVTGCVATSMAIVMKYYEYPEKAVGGVSSYNGTSINYDEYDWQNMLLDYNCEYTNDQGYAVAKLMWHCGANVEMDYGLSGSSSSSILAAWALKNVFGYSESIQWVDKNAYSWDKWISLFKAEIDGKRPIMVSGNDGFGGHSFVCDGYSSDNTFHINWGWEGYMDGWFLLTSLDSDGDGYGYADRLDSYGAIIGIQPTDGEPADISLYITGFSYSGTTPLPTYVTVTAKYHYCITQVIECMIGLAVVDDDGNIVQTPTYYSSHKWTNLGAHVYLPSSSNYSIQLEKALEEGQRLAMVHSVDSGETWKVTHVGADVPIGLDNDGLIMQEEDEDEEAEPVTWTFTPEEGLDFTSDEEATFLLTATDVPEEYIGKSPVISLNVESAYYYQVEMSYVKENGDRTELEITQHPDWLDDYLCISQPMELESLAEGKQYEFTFRYTGDFPYGSPAMGDIQLESVTIDGTELPLDMRAGIDFSVTKAEEPVIYITEEEPYAADHEGRDVVVEPNGIYVIGSEGASINSLTIEDGGQVRLTYPLTVTNLEVQRLLPTDKWTTFAVPNFNIIDNRLIVAENKESRIDLFANGTLVARYGYMDPDMQYWGWFMECDMQQGTAIAIANAGSESTQRFVNAISPAILPAVSGVTDDGNVVGGNWFYFKPNPLWENLYINGRAYVLNDTGDSFDLKDSPVIPPFHSYMVASDAVMNSISSLRLSDVPTSNEELAVTGFRAWGEKGGICFETTDAKDVYIYSITGVLQQSYERSVGTKRAALGQGIYIVVCDGTAYKISVK